MKLSLNQMDEIFSRNCPQCQRVILYKNECTLLNAQTKQTFCKSCNTKNVQSLWSPEKRKLANRKMVATKNAQPEDVKFSIREKIKATNLETWKILPEAFVKATLENPEWYEKLRANKKKFKDPIHRGHRISEGKTGIPYEQWLVIKGMYETYAMKVRTHTSMQPLKLLQNYELRGFRTYHLDHKYSVIEGFRNNVAPEIIGNIVNLEYLPMKENLSKGTKCSLTLDQLLKAYNDSLQGGK